MDMNDLDRMFPRRAVYTRKRKAKKPDPNGAVRTRKATWLDLLFFDGTNVGGALTVKAVTPDNPAIPVVKSKWWPGMLDHEAENGWAFTGSTGGTTKL